MSKKKGTAEKSFIALYVDGQTEDDFQRRVTRNLGVALFGPFGDERYEKARDVYTCSLGIQLVKAAMKKLSERQGRESPKNAKMRQKFDARILESFEREIQNYFNNALQKRDGRALRMLADVLDGMGQTVSADASDLIRFCGIKGHDHVFTFKRLLSAYGVMQNLKPPYEDATVKRLKRLAKSLNIRFRRGQ